MSEHRDDIIHPEMVPISSINPLFPYVSYARQNMASGFLTQSNVIKGASRKRIRSGFEREHAKGTFKYTFDKDVTILDIIHKYPKSFLKNPDAINPKSIIIYEEHDTKMLGCVELNRFHVMHMHYGFNYKYNEDTLNNLGKGSRFRAGTVIADSPNVTEDGDYMLGLEANLAFLTDPAGSEDGYVLSQSFSSNISTTGFETRTFSCGRSHYPINLNGTPDKYKSIPDIGDKINSNGLIAAFRPLTPSLDPIYMTDRHLMKTAHGMDMPLYGIANATIVDINVHHNNIGDDRGLPSQFTEQLRRYWEEQKRYYMAILRACLGRRKGWLSEDANIHPDLWSVLYDAIVYCGTDLVDEGLWNPAERNLLERTRSYRNDPLDEWRVDITFEYKTEVAEGPKLSNYSASKGVSVAVWPDECMPKDDFGNVADVIIFGGSTTGRMTLGQVNEQLIGAVGRDVIKRVRRALNLPDMGELKFNEVFDLLYKSDKKLVRELYDYVLGWYKQISSDSNYPVAKGYLEDGDRWIKHLAHVIVDGNEPYGMFIHMPAGTEVRMRDVNKFILETDEYKPEISPVTFKWPNDTEFTRTETPVLIGPNYFLALEKTATDWSAVSSSKVGHFGTTAKMTQADKYTKPGRETSTRTMGEDENRNLAKTIGGEILADIHDRNNNPLVHREVCKSIVTADKPTNIASAINREESPVGGHRILSWVNHISLTSGKSFKRGNDDEKV